MPERTMTSCGQHATCGAKELSRSLLYLPFQCPALKAFSYILQGHLSTKPLLWWWHCLISFLRKKFQKTKESNELDDDGSFYRSREFHWACFAKFKLINFFLRRKRTEFQFFEIQLEFLKLKYQLLKFEFDFLNFQFQLKFNLNSLNWNMNF